MSARDDALISAIYAGANLSVHGNYSISVDAFVATLAAAGWVVARVPDEVPDDSGHPRSIGYRIGYNACRATMIAAAEREACVAICEDVFSGSAGITLHPALRIADAIRARATSPASTPQQP